MHAEPELTNESGAAQLHTLIAFGQRIELYVPTDTFMREDSLWRLHNIYEPFLASRSVSQSGVAVDIGAGFGAFAIPLALSYPGLTLHCYEPIKYYYDLLQANIRLHKLDNIKAYNTAVMAAANSKEQSADAERHSATTIQTQEFLCSLLDSGFIESGADLAEYNHDNFVMKTLPVIHASALAALQPDLVKIIAPGHESGILNALAGNYRQLVGESWHPLQVSSLFEQATNETEIFLKLAGTDLALRKDRDTESDRRHGLDIVVSMYNARTYIIECLNSLLAKITADIHIIVVNDGSTDGCDTLVSNTFNNHPHINLVSKPNGGCASARNYGRRCSNADHIAFVDADDMVDPGMFSSLLDLARLSGAEIVQASFDTFEHNNQGQYQRQTTYEQLHYDEWERRTANGINYIQVPAANLLVGQPTIWRRVYRRDFLDNKAIFFPEQIRAFDDQIFQILSLYLAQDVLMLDGPRYLYRQHPDQDIQQGDERHFYALEMFRLVFKRSLAEGWNDHTALLRSFINTINWSCSMLRGDLVDDFVIGAAQLWVYTRMALGAGPFANAPVSDIQHPDFAAHVATVEGRLQGIEDSYILSHLDSLRFQPAFLKLRKNLEPT